MSLTLGQTVKVLAEANKSSAKTATGIIAGNVINDRLVKIIQPKLPYMVQGYAKTPLGRAALSNLAAGAIVHFFPTNVRAQQAAAAMIESAMVDFASSFNIEAIIDELLDGVNLPEVNIPSASDVADSVAKATGVRLAADETKSEAS